MFTLTILALSVCHSSSNLGMWGSTGSSDFVCQGKQTIDLPTLAVCREALKGTDLYGTRQYESVDVVITTDKIAYCAPTPPPEKPLSFTGPSSNGTFTTH